MGAIPLSAEQAGRIESLLGRAAFASWFRDCAWRQGDGGRYPGGEIVAPTQFMADYIATQFGSKVGEAFGGRVRVIAADRRVGSPSPAAPVQ